MKLSALADVRKYDAAYCERQRALDAVQGARVGDPTRVQLGHTEFTLLTMTAGNRLRFAIEAIIKDEIAGYKKLLESYGVEVDV